MKVSVTEQQVLDGLKLNNDIEKLQSFQRHFYHKYKGYVYKVANRCCRHYPDSEQLASDITQETFIKAFRKAKELDLSKEPDLNKHEYIIKAWLGVIANNCFKKEYRKRKDEVYIDIDDLNNHPEEKRFDLFESLYGDEPIEIPNEFRSKLRQVMETLTEQQQHIILTYANEGCINSQHHLSNGAMKHLCEMYNTSPENVRQIKKRTLDKIKKMLFPNEQINNYEKRKKYQIS